MKLKPIINSLLENDLYKVNMQQVVLHQFNKDVCKWAFKCRNEDVKFTSEMVKEIKEQLDHYCELSFREDELAWMRETLPWLSFDYIEFLRMWRPRRSEIRVNEVDMQPAECGLAIEVVGTWLNTMMHEMPILSIVNEVYFAFKYGAGARDAEFQLKTLKKADELKSGKWKNIPVFSEFGLRRRYSGEMQDWLVKCFKQLEVPGFVGTSNMFLARKHGVKPVGTMAHEQMMAMQGHVEWNPAFANKRVMEAWTEEYGVENGIYLTDCLTTDVFLLDFDKKFATLFSGLRHDSGDPLAWGDKILTHYEKLGIDPKTKTLLFSDSLNFEKADEIGKHFTGRCKIAFGIGTFLSNPFDDALNIVCKLVECNGQPVAKISDCAGKTMCRSEEYVEYLKRCLSWRLRYEKKEM